jgi:hypothetical protein
MFQYNNNVLQSTKQKARLTDQTERERERDSADTTEQKHAHQPTEVSHFALQMSY